MITANVEQTTGNNLSIEQQDILKAYLNRFLQDIHTVRLRIFIHEEIANVVKTGYLRHQQFWGFMQNNVNVSLVVANMFSIFDDNHKHTLKTFIRLLKSYKIKTITMNDVDSWLRSIHPYEQFRNKMIAHSDINRPIVPPVYYEKFLELLAAFENKLQQISKEYITDLRVRNGTWSVSVVDLGTPVLSELREMLSEIYIEESKTQVS